MHNPRRCGKKVSSPPGVHPPSHRAGLCMPGLSGHARVVGDVPGASATDRYTFRVHAGPMPLTHPSRGRPVPLNSLVLTPEITRE
ncbi:hypothetical protein SVIO_094700 [Streptomyces violaceusniger]|uniref:Uncharacterized protein n=1 Tax=Streptomyces violaceusniger TaxID=68280 RepID=A0A4D4LKE5_STRVO|nr:hypothetical protein SVIO_094700 [Streptomyces violaceusniger]